MAMLADQVAVISGAGSGIGKAIAIALATHGASVCLVGRTLATLEDVAHAICVTGGSACCYQADLTLDADLRDLTMALQRDCPALDMLVHSAGVFASGRLEQTPVEELDRQYRTNVRAPYSLTQALLPLLRIRKGQIVFVNSSVSLGAARAGGGQYAATKHALKAIADSLRDEVNPEGLRVLSIYPGRTASPMQAAIYAAEGRVYYPERLLQPEDVAATVLHTLLLPRTAEVTDINIRPLTKMSP